ncbi:protein kinase domain-containing protein [Streptomyces alboflavus]|uniref:protein kinase domain-containing protein n=1 Tax=Streptomyces alboflavus TaxID=67267 RepID=UPI0004CCF7EE|nr:ABC transporter substrate-binding protein [Streptomyces alboflavus]
MRGAVLDGRYTLTERIGAGGMGAVWRARDARLDREVAVKLLGLPQDTSAPDRERMLALFVREARAAAALDSTYIVPVFDHGSEGDSPYLVMPLLNGRTVTELLRNGKGLSPQRVADIAAQVCRALAVAHRAGIVHRDIKPANVMVTDEGTVKVLDFGIAKFLDAATGAGGYLTRTSDSPIGTLHYMAPERFAHGETDGRTDVYSLGCMVHEMLTGAPPFDAPSAAALMHCHVYETPDRPSLRRPGLSPAWDDLVGRMLAKAPADRPDAEGTRSELEARAKEASVGLTKAAPAAPASAAPATGTPNHAPATPGTPSPGAATPGTPGTPNPGTPTPPASAPTPPAPAHPAPAAPSPFGPPPSAQAPLAQAGHPADSGPQPVPTSYPLPPPRPTAPPPLWPAPVAHHGQVPAGRPWWRTWWVPGGAAVAVAALVVTLTVTDPFGGTKDDSGKGTSGGTSDRPKPGPKGSTVAERAKTETLVLGTADDSEGPAPAVAEARKGGKVTVLEPADLTTVDPGKMWSGTDRLVSRLVHRSLTGLKTLPDGRVKLVGDLATDGGRASSGGRTWTFTLKPGLTYNDGTPVLAKDFVNAVQRTLDPSFAIGDRTLRSWLLGPKAADGGSGDRTLPPGTIETPDDRTVVFHLESARPDFNVALAGPSGAPVPDRVKDTSTGSPTVPSTGPYEVSTFTGAKDVVLTRNSEWKADSDPLRTAYPDTYRIEGGLSVEDIKSRTVSAGSSEAVMSFTGSLGKDGLGKNAGGAGRLSAPSAFIHAYQINTRRVKDVKVRKAIATALPAGDVLAASGEDGTVHHNLLPPGVRGARPFDLYGAGEHGDPAKARALLKDADESGFRLTLGHADATDAERAQVIKAALDRAGFQVKLQKDDTTDYYKNAGTGKYDLFRLPVGAGLPVGSATLPEYFDGKYSYPTSSNYSRLKNSGVDSAIDAAGSAGSLRDAGELWSTVDRRVMEQAAAVPVYVPMRTYLYSKALHGLQVDLDGVSPLNAYVR